MLKTIIENLTNRVDRIEACAFGHADEIHEIREAMEIFNVNLVNMHQRLDKLHAVSSKPILPKRGRPKRSDVIIDKVIHG